MKGIRNEGDFYIGSMAFLASGVPDMHGKTLSDAERRAMVRRLETELSILYSEELKLKRERDEHELEVRKLRDALKRITFDMKDAETRAKKREVEVRTVEENIRQVKRRINLL